MLCWTTCQIKEGFWCSSIFHLICVLRISNRRFLWFFGKLHFVRFNFKKKRKKVNKETKEEKERRKRKKKKLRVNWVLCVSTSFWVLHSLKSWSKYLFCLIYIYIGNFCQKTRKGLIKTGHHPNASWLTEGVPQFFVFVKNHLKCLKSKKG